MSSGPRQRCEHCNREFSYQYYWNHMRKFHGEYGGYSGAERMKQSRRNGNPEAVAMLTRETKEPERETRKFTVMPFVVLEDDNGGLWIAERLR